MPELSHIQVNAAGQMFTSIPMPPLNDMIYIVMGFNQYGGYIWKYYEEEDRWTE